MPPSSLLDLVHWYRELGLSILPIQPRGKNPQLASWKDFQQHQASEEEVARWFQKDNVGVGIVTGAVSGNLWVLDFEDRRGFDAWVEANMPDTLLVYSGRGGHAYFRAPWSVRHRAKGSNPWLVALNLEILGEGHQVVAPPSIHPNGKRYRWHPDSGDSIMYVAAPYEWLKEAFGTAAGMPVPKDIVTSASSWGDISTPTVTSDRKAVDRLLAGEGKLDGQWHIEAVALAGKLAKERVPTSLINLALDDLASRSSWKDHRNFKIALEAIKRDALRWRHEAVEQSGADPYEETPPAATPGALSRVFLDPLLAGEAPEVEWVYENVLVAGRIHILYGEPESGKTILCLGIIRDLCERGLKTIYIDEESGQVSVTNLLRSMNLEQVDDCLHYFPFNSLDLKDTDALLAYCDELQPSLVMFDSLTDMIAAAGLDENSGQDVTKWMLAVAQTLARRDYAPAVVLIDHVTKSVENTRYSVGSRAKKAKTDVMWLVDKVQPFDQQTKGQVTLYRHKNRPGILPRSVSFTIGGTPLIVQRTCEEKTATTISSLTELERAIMEAVRTSPAPCTRLQIEEQVGRKRSVVNTALAALCKRGLLWSVGAGPSKTYANRDRRTVVEENKFEQWLGVES